MMNELYSFISLAVKVMGAAGLRRSNVSVGHIGNV